jgi:hypothetical protein
MWGEHIKLSANHTTTLPTHTPTDHNTTLRNTRTVHAATRHPAAHAAERRSKWLNMTIGSSETTRVGRLDPTSSSVTYEKRTSTIKECASRQRPATHHRVLTITPGTHNPCSQPFATVSASELRPEVHIHQPQLGSSRKLGGFAELAINVDQRRCDD